MTDCDASVDGLVAVRTGRGMSIMKRGVMKPLWLLALGPLVLLLAVSSCGGSDETASSKPSEESSRIDTHESRDVTRYNFSAQGPGGSGFGFPEALSVETVLEKGLDGMGLSPVHLAFRGTAGADSIRCEWRGVARTLGQRDAYIRFWLGIAEDDPLPSAIDADSRFMTALKAIDPLYPETAQSTFGDLSRGGLSNSYLYLICFADFRVAEYLLGSGPSSLTVSLGPRAEARSYDLYRKAHDVGEFGPTTLLSEGDYRASTDQARIRTEQRWSSLIGGFESVVFLAPAGAHNVVTTEAWQVVDQWDLQTAEDGTVNAVRYGTSAGDPEHTQTLAELKSRVTAATTPGGGASGASGDATPAAMPTRIPNVSGLTQYYRDIGAYGDITPGDDATTTFTPAPPPPPYACAGGTAVTNPGLNRALVHDCEALLAAKDALAGTAALNWSVDVAITEWDGVKVSGTPRRVTELKLANRNLTGVIPPELGRLTYLDALWLNGNRLSGEIPPELGGLVNLNTLLLYTNQLSGEIPSQLGTLTNLRILRLSGNSLTGCIPAVLKNLGASNDLGRLGLAYCDAPCSFPSSSGGGCSG